MAQKLLAVINAERCLNGDERLTVDIEVLAYEGLRALFYDCGDWDTLRSDFLDLAGIQE